MNTTLRKASSLTAAITLIGSLIGGANAAVISVNFVGTGGTGASSSLEAADVTGVKSVSNWNNITSGNNSGSNATTSNLKDDSGIVTTTDITYFQRFWSINGGTSNDGELNSGYTNTASNADGVISLVEIGSEFTTSGYDLIIYLGGTDGQGANTPIEVGATVGSETKWIRHVRPSEGAVSAYDSTTFSTEALAQASSGNSNYIRFNGLTSDSLSINILKDPSSTASWSRAGVKGIQLVAVPEPSSAALLGLACLSFAFRRSRH